MSACNHAHRDIVIASPSFRLSVWGREREWEGKGGGKGKGRGRGRKGREGERVVEGREGKGKDRSSMASQSPDNRLQNLTY